MFKTDIRAFGWRRWAAVLSCAVLPAILGVYQLTAGGARFAAAASDTSTNLVVNPGGGAGAFGWRAVTQRGQAAVSAVVTSTPVSSTAIQVTTTGSGASAYEYALAKLTSPATDFVVGRSYTARVWYRDGTGTGHRLTLLVANGAYKHRPSTASQAVSYADTAWHEVELDFTATATGSGDTGLYLALPNRANVTYQFASASLVSDSAPTSSAAGVTAPLVTNPSGVGGATGWSAGTSSGTATVVAVHDANPVADSAVQVATTRAGAATTQLALASLTAPATSFIIGKTYRMEVWYRDVKGNGARLLLCLANGAGMHSPSSTVEHVTYDDTAWHHVQRTFVATDAAYSDTALYLGLPGRANLLYQFAGAAVTAVDGDEPATVASSPTTTIPFSGAKGSLPGGVWDVRTGGGGWGNDEVETYTARTANAQVDGKGDLTITTRKETYRGSDGITRNYTSARVDTGGDIAIQPGSYVEATISAPTASGAWPAFWMLGTSIFKVGWPASGELDMFEGAGNATVAHSAAHMAAAASSTTPMQYGWGQGGGTTTLDSAVSSPHTYGVYFDKNTVRFYIDHEPTMSLWASDAAVSGRAWPFAQSMGIVVNSAVTSQSAAAAGTWPQAMTVSPVRVYAGGVPF